MAKKLKTYVSVTDEEGAVHTYGPEDDVPGDVAKLITNPDAWDEGDEDDDEDSRIAAARTSYAGTQEFDSADEEADDKAPAKKTAAKAAPPPSSSK